MEKGQAGDPEPSLQGLCPLKVTWHLQDPRVGGEAKAGVRKSQIFIILSHTLPGLWLSAVK